MYYYRKLKKRRLQRRILLLKSRRKLKTVILNLSRKRVKKIKKGRLLK